MIETFVGQLAQLTPFIIYDKQIYQITQGIETRYKIELDGCKFGLSPGPSIEEIERYSRELDATEIFEFKKEFIQQKLKKEMISEKVKNTTSGKEVGVEFHSYRPVSFDD